MFFLISSHDGEIPRVWSLSPNLSWSNPKFSLLNRNCSWVYKSRFLMVKSHFLMVKSHFFMVSPWFFSLPSLGGFARTKAIAWKLHQQHMDLARRSELLPGINWINSLPMGKKSSFKKKKKHLDFIKFCLVIDNLSFIIYNLRSIFAWLNHSNSNTAMWVLWGTFPYEASYIKYLYLYLPVYLPIYLIKLSDQVLDGVGNMFGGWWWGDGVEGWQMA